MTNYLNQIESELYKLNAMTNSNGEVVEMVAELKEKYLKAAAFDAIVEQYEEIMKEKKKYESGEYDAKK